MIVLGLACGLPVAAQDLAAPALGAGVQRTLTLDTSAEAVHDTNISRSSAAVARQRGLFREDNIVTPGVDLAFVQPVGRQALFLNATAGYSFHQKNPVLDREKILASGGVAALAGPCQTAAGGAYNRQVTTLEDETELATDIVNDTLRERSVNLQVSCGVPAGFGIQMSGSQSWAKHSLARRLTSDVDRSTAQAGVVYKRPALGSVTLYGEYTETTYPNRLQGTALVQDGYELLAGGLRYERSFGSRYMVAASASYQSMTTNVATAQAFDGVAGEATVTFTPTKRLNATLSYSRVVSASTQSNASYQIQTDLGGQVSYVLGTQMTVALGALRRHRTFRGESLDPLRDITQDRKMSYTASLDYKIGRRLVLSVEAEHDVRDAKPVAFSYVGDRIGVTARTSFGS